MENIEEMNLPTEGGRSVFCKEAKEEIERLKAMHAQRDAKKDAKLAFETERAEEYQETVLNQEQVIENLLGDSDRHEWRIPPPPPSR